MSTRCYSNHYPEWEKWASLNPADSASELSKIPQHNRGWRSCHHLHNNNKERWVQQPYPEQRNNQASFIQCSHWEDRSGKPARFPSRKSTCLPNSYHVHGCKGIASFSNPWSGRCHRPIFAAKEHPLLNQCKKTASNAWNISKSQMGDEQKHALASRAICPSSLIFVVLHIDLLFQIRDFQK